MPYLLLTVAAIIGLFGIAKIRRAGQPAQDVPWGQWLVWAALFGGSLSIWLLISN
jgi:hypothetical protein